MRGAQGYGRAKVLMGAMVIGILMTGISIPVIAENPYYIQGYTYDYDTGEPLEGVELAFKNTATEEIVSITSGQGGFYQLCMNEFDSGWDFEDVLYITHQKLDYLSHTCSFTLYSDPWDNIWDLNIFLRLANNNILNNPYVEDIGDMQLSCRCPSYYWYEQSGFTKNFPIGDQHDGVKIIEGYSYSDSGNSVPVGMTYKVEINFSFKISDITWGDNNRIVLWWGNYTTEYTISHPLGPPPPGRDPPEFVVELTKNSINHKLLEFYAQIGYKITDYDSGETIQDWTYTSSSITGKYNWIA